MATETRRKWGPDNKITFRDDLTPMEAYWDLKHMKPEQRIIVTSVEDARKELEWLAPLIYSEVPRGSESTRYLNKCGAAVWHENELMFDVFDYEYEYFQQAGKELGWKISGAGQLVTGYSRAELYATINGFNPPRDFNRHTVYQHMVLRIPKMPRLIKDVKAEIEVKFDGELPKNNKKLRQLWRELYNVGFYTPPVKKRVKKTVKKLPTAKDIDTVGPAIKKRRKGEN